MVEDSLVCQRLIGRLVGKSLGKLGCAHYSITTVSTLAEAHLQLKSHRFSLIISDYNLKHERAGPDLVGSIRSDDRHPNYDTPAIAFSSEVASEADIEGTCMDGFIPKAARPELVQAVLQAHLPRLGE